MAFGRSSLPRRLAVTLLRLTGRPLFAGFVANDWGAVSDPAHGATGEMIGAIIAS